MNSKLEIFAQREQQLLASIASLKLELENTNETLCIVKDEANEKTIEMEDYINQLQVDLNAALMEKAETKECLSNLNEALQEVHHYILRIFENFFKIIYIFYFIFIDQ